MEIIGEVDSWSRSKNKDCFGNGEPETVDHIYPLSEGGNNILENKQLLSHVSNNLKGNKTRGYIGNNWRFAVVEQTTSDDEIYGVMRIRHKNWEEDDWKEVIPVTYI